MTERKYSKYALGVREERVTYIEDENVRLTAKVAKLTAEVAELRQKRGSRRKVKTRDFTIAEESWAKLSPEKRRIVDAMMRVIMAIMGGRQTIVCLEAQFREDDGTTTGIEAFDANDAKSSMIYELAGRLQSLLAKTIFHADEARENEREESVEERTAQYVEDIVAEVKYREPQGECDCPRCQMLRRLREAKRGPFDPRNVN